MFGYSWLRTGQHTDFVHELLDACEHFDIAIEALHTETGPGVYEVAHRYDVALRRPTRPRCSRRWPRRSPRTTG